MYRICIWTPINTHLQSAFHDTIVKNGKIDLQVRYFQKIPKERIELGWEDKQHTKSFEKNVDSLVQARNSLDDFEKRIHIISGNGYSFTRDLIDYCINEDLVWIIWIERSGVQLFYLLKQNSILFNIFFSLYQTFYNRNFAKKIDKYALGFFASGIRAEEDYLKRGVNQRKIKHLYYALQPLEKTDIIPNELQNFEFKHNYIYVGSLSQRKGTDILLKAFSYIRDNNWGLILVGKDTDDNYYKKIAQKLKISEKVFFTGTVNTNDINQYLSFADVFILPSRFDGWGAVLNEAASLGMPMISTEECGAAHHLIQNSVNGYVVKANSAKLLYNAMHQYCINENLIIEHSRESKKLFANFTVEANVDRLLNNLIELDVKNCIKI